METAQTKKMPVAISEHGTRIRLSGLFRGDSPSLSPFGKQKLQEVVSLLWLYPHGVVNVQICVGNPSEKTNRRLSKDRFTRIISKLTSQIKSKTRIQFVPCIDSERETESVTLIFDEYRSALKQDSQ